MLCFSFIAVMLMASLFNSGDAATFSTPAGGDASVNVDENEAVGTTVVTIAATVAAGGTLGNFMLATQDVPFALAGDTGVLTVSQAVLNFEDTQTYTLLITVTDTAADSSVTTATATLTVSVQNVDENPTFAKDTYNVCVVDESAAGTTVTTLSAVDPDAGATQTYSITAGNTGTDLTISSDKLTVVNALSKTRTETYTLTITVTDDASNTDTASFIVTVAGTCSGASALAVSLTTLLLGLVYALN